MVPDDDCGRYNHRPRQKLSGTKMCGNLATRDGWRWVERRRREGEGKWQRGKRKKKEFRRKRGEAAKRREEQQRERQEEIKEEWRQLRKASEFEYIENCQRTGFKLKKD